MLEREDVRRLIPNDMQFLWSAKTRIMGEGKRFFTLYPVKRAAELTGRRHCQREGGNRSELQSRRSLPWK